jgi:membrane fusion protein, multidrug efflux system
MTTPTAPTSLKPRRRGQVLLIVGGIVLLILAVDLTLTAVRTHSSVSALADAPQPVLVVAARSASWQAQGRYVGRVEAWQAARLGPQVAAAHVVDVLVRPGDVVKAGQVLARLDCRGAAATSQSVAAQARALEEHQHALEQEASRLSTLLDGGFVSTNDIEQRRAQLASSRAQVDSMRSQLDGRALEVDDCVLKAPFAGEVAERAVDPGAYVRPGSTVVSVVDRTRLRVSAEVPETDFAALPPETTVRLHSLATGAQVTGQVSRRAPAADPSTRTIHVEVDLAPETSALPVGTTVEVFVDIGTPVPALELPLVAARVKNGKASVMTVVDDVARVKALPVLGERGGSLFVAPDAGVASGALVVSEGRSLLSDGAKVVARLAEVRR